MATPYRCGSPGRRALIVEQAPGPDRVDGIDYLTVYDDPDGPLELRQRLLILRFFFGDDLASLGIDDIEISGGLRIPTVPVVYVAPAAGFDPTTLPADTSPAAVTAITDAVAALGDQTARSLVVLTELPGDFSQYTLRLWAIDDTPPGFDRRLSALSFNFKVECPTPFDCADDTACPPDALEQPEIDYLARDFNSFRRLMLDRMALLDATPQSSAAATMRATLVEALAYSADRLSYYQDAVATEATLATARSRRSVRRHARLLDYAMHDGCNARAFVHLQIDEGVTIAAGSLRRGATLLTRLPDLPTVITTDQLDDALVQGPLGFALLADAPVLTDAHNLVPLHTWGDEDCCLPAGSTQATLVDDGGLQLQAGDLLLLEEVASPHTGRTADADPSHRHVVRLVAVSARFDDPLTGSGYREVQWHDDDALPRAMVISSDQLAEAGEVQAAVVARANLVLVDHGLRLEAEPLTLRPFGLQGRMLARLSRSGLTFRQPLDLDSLATRSARDSLLQDPRAALPDVELAGEDETWQPRRDLLGSAASATDFVVELENDGRAWLRFGDGVMGRAPQPDAAFTATWRLGNGPTGNVGAEAIFHLVEDIDTVDGSVTAGVVALRNPLAASGGTAAERLDEVKLYAPQAFRVQERAVTEADWAEVCTRHPDVARAVARIRWTGSWHTVFVAVDRVGGAEVDEAFEAELEDFLGRYRLAGVDVEVTGPKAVPLEIALSVCVAPGFLPEHVEAALLRVFGAGLLPDGSRAFFHPDNFSFGDPVYLSRILARASRVPGVLWVDAAPPTSASDPPHRFKRLWAPDDGSLAAGRIQLDPLEIARCDSDPSLPENGRISFLLRGGA